MEYCKHIVEHNKTPQVEDKPWNMSGWFLLRVQDAEMSVWGKKSRWQYYFQMKSYIEPEFALKTELSHFVGDAGAIPKRDFTSFSQEAYDHLRQCVETFAGYAYDWSGFRDFLRYLLFSSGLSDFIPNVPEKNKQALFELIDPSLLLKNPFDYLGRMILDNRGKGSWNPNAFYPTPASVVKCMNEIMFHDEKSMDEKQGKDTRFKTMLEPCCGTGAILLEASNESLYLKGQDIDPMLVDVCMLNGILFVPWMVFGLANINNESKETKQQREHLLQTLQVTKVLRSIFSLGISSRINRTEQQGPMQTQGEENITQGIPEPVVDAEDAATHSRDSKNEKPRSFVIPTAKRS